MRVAVLAAVLTQQLVIYQLAQAQASNAASKGTGNGAKYGTSTYTPRASNDANLHADTGTGQCTSCRRRCSTCHATSNSANITANALAVITENYPLRTTAWTGSRHSDNLMRQAS